MIPDSDLRKLQLIQADILMTVTDICSRYNLDYWLDAGTLLGAVRHSGYIPWDDDIDIGMLRNDYNKLLKILPSELPDNLILQTSKTDKNYKNDWAKVRDLYSEVISASGEKSKLKHNGARIDIFPFDYVPKNRLLQKMQLLIINSRAFFKGDINKMKNVTPIKKAIHSAGQVIPKSLFNFIYNISIKASNALFNEYISCYFQLPNLYKKNTRPTDCYFPLKKITFENREYKCPSNNHCYLEFLYGKDYMTPVKYPEHISGVIFYTENKNN